jgi:hypothetical protein
MDLLRNLFGNVTSGIIRLAVTAGILFLTYLFLVKPVLETTDKVIRQSGFDQISKSLSGVGEEIRTQVNRSLKATRGQAEHRKLMRCIERAGQNTVRLQRCARRY